MDKGFLSVKEVANYLNVKISTVYSRVNEIPHYRVGRLLRFKKLDIEAWMEGQRRESKQVDPARTNHRATTSVDLIVRAAIDEAKASPYTSNGKSGQSKSLAGKEED